ncbi:MAG: polyprenyl synthetase family protein [Acidobacteriota bacterium]
MKLNEYLQSRRALVDATLDEHLPPAHTPPARIHEAMRYAVLGGGKRIRPIVALAGAEACGAEIESLLVPIAALELIHTYSLVHDDLPAMDDDDLRRGRKTTHVVYGEAIGILTGDALLTEAFAWLARPVVDAERQLRAIREVAAAVDSRGMIGGQVADMEGTSTEGTIEQLEFIHRNKTGKLLTASVVFGGLLAGASDDVIDALRRYGDAVGLAFQIVDDLLDVEESAATLGKTAGKDVAQQKLTYPALLGPEAARAQVEALLAAAVENAGMIPGPVNYLAEIARFICERRS